MLQMGGAGEVQYYVWSSVESKRDNVFGIGMKEDL